MILVVVVVAVAVGLKLEADFVMADFILHWQQSHLLIVVHLTYLIEFFFLNQANQFSSST